MQIKEKCTKRKEKKRKEKDIIPNVNTTKSFRDKLKMQILHRVTLA